MGNCSSADMRGSFIRKRGRSFRTRDEDICAYGARSSDDEDDVRDKLVHSEDHAEQDKGVVPSDSGIESLGPSTDEGQEDICRKCRQRFQNHVCQSCEQNALQESPCRSEPESYCSCGPRNARIQQTWQKNHICKTHLHSPKFYRHSDIIDVKSSLKKGRRKVPDRRSQFSCKSSDSLDYAGCMQTSMDNAKSVVSEIFRDDISLRAPLAAFDSLEGQLDSEETTRRERTLSQIEDLTQRVCQCENYAENIVKPKQSKEESCRNSRISPDRKESCINGFTEDVLRTSFSKGTRYQPSIPNGSVRSNNDVYTENVTVELPGYQKVIMPSPVKESRVRCNSYRSSFSGSEDSFALSLPPEVTTTVVNGQEMVMMSIPAYRQLLDELHLLKSQLTKLSDVLQENINTEDLSSEVD